MKETLVTKRLHGQHANRIAGLIVCGASLLFSLQLIVQKFATAGAISVVSVVAGSFFVVGLCLAPIALKRTTLRIAPLDYGGLFLLACARLGAMCFYFVALELLPASNAVLLFYLAPLLLLIQMALFGAERIRPFHAIVFAMAFGGIMIALDVSQGSNITGVISGLLAALTFSFDFILTKRFIPQGRAFASYSLCSLLISLIVLVLGAAIYIVTPENLPDITLEYLILILALTPLILLPYFFLAIAIQIIGASKTALYTLSEPIFVIFLSAVIGWEMINIHMVSGAAMVIGALLLLNIASDNSE